MKIPAYIVLQTLSLMMFIFALFIIVLAGMDIASDQLPSTEYDTIMVILGAVLLIVGLVGPAKIIFKGFQLPVEIKRMIRVQAYVLPLLGVSLILSGIMNSGMLEACLNLFMGLLILLSALFGFYPLSKTLPDTFYMDEMLSIIKSAGLVGGKEESMADRALMRWTSGMVDGVAVGQVAPDGEVITMTGERVLLSSFFTDKPLVLNFGSYSCPHHRKRISELHTLMKAWQSQGVDFLTVYTAEAHPEDDWKLEHQYENDVEFTNDDDFCFYYAKNIDDRKEMAQWLIDKKHFKMDVVLDVMEDKLLKAYNSWPIRLYVIHEGKVIYCGEQGPFGYSPTSVDTALNKLSENGQ